MKQLSLHISLTKNDHDINNEINRLSALNHNSVANEARKLIREGLEYRKAKKTALV